MTFQLCRASLRNPIGELGGKSIPRFYGLSNSDREMNITSTGLARPLLLLYVIFVIDNYLFAKLIRLAAGVTQNMKCP